MAQLVGTNYAPGTLERFETSLSHTVEFLKWKYCKSDMEISNINYSFLADYEFWLKTVRKCNQNTTTKYLGNFRKIINLCLKNGWMDRDPFYGFKMTRVEVDREYLTEAKLQTIYNKESSISGSPRLEIFSCSAALLVLPTLM